LSNFDHMIKIISRWAMPTFFLARRHCYLCALLIALPVSSHGTDTPAGLFISARDVTLSDGLPVRNLNGDWRLGYEASVSNPRAMRYAQIEMGWQSTLGAWSFLERKEAFLQMSADTAALLALYQQKTSPEVSTNNRSAYASFFGWHAKGGAWRSNTWQWQNTEVRLGIQGFQLQELRQYETSGTWGADASGVYHYEVQATDVSSRFHLPPSTTLGSSSSKGWGGSLSFDITHQLNHTHRLRFVAEDAYSQLRWPQLTTQEERLSTFVKSRNTNGYIDYAPAVVGQFRSSTFITHIPTKWSSEWRWKSYSWLETSVSWIDHFGIQQRWFGANYLTGTFNWGFAVEPVRNAKQLSLNHSQWQFCVAWDQPHSNANHLLSWHTTFMFSLN
jgi:hypothetical protein